MRTSINSSAHHVLSGRTDQDGGVEQDMWHEGRNEVEDFCE